MRKIIFLVLLTFVLGFLAFNLLPKKEIMKTEGIYAKKDRQELISDANVIIRGTVKEVLASKWSNPELKKGNDVRNIIQTDIVVNIEDVYKGLPYNENKVIVRINKGKIKQKNIETISESEGYPDFVIGEEVILFLSLDDGDLADPDEDYYVLTGMRQGKFELKNTKNGDKIFKNFSDRDTFSISTVKKDINEELEYLKKNPISKMSKEEIENQNEKLFGK